MKAASRVFAALLLPASLGSATACSSLGAGGSTGPGPGVTTVTVVPLQSSEDDSSGVGSTIPTSIIPSETTTTAAIGTAEVRVAGFRPQGIFSPVTCADDDNDGDLDITGGFDQSTGRFEVEVADPEGTPQMTRLNIRNVSINISMDSSSLFNPADASYPAKVTREGNVWIFEGYGRYEDNHTRTDHIFLKAECP